MDHSTVLKTLAKLAPAIRKEGAEAVLLKYAADNSLSPAQLEKCAQIWNVVRTVNTFDKAAQSGGTRGQTFEVIEVPELVKKYAAFAPAPKAARKSALDAWLIPDAPKQASSRLPDFMSQARGIEQPKAAAAQAGPDRTIPTDAFKLRAFKRAATQALEHELAELALLKAGWQGAAVSGARKLAAQVREHGPAHFSYLEHDTVVHLGMEPAKRAFDEVARVCKEDRFKVAFKRASEIPDTRCVASDRFGVVKAAADIAENLGLVASCDVLAADLRAKIASGLNGNPSQEAEPAEVTGFFDRLGGGSDEQRANLMRAINHGLPVDSSAGAPAPGTSATATTTPSGKPAPAGKGDDKIPSLGMIGAGTTTLSGLMSHVRDKATTISGSTESPSLMDMISGGGPGYNAVQKGVDTAAHEVRDVTNLERLMRTDSIIAEADPSKVVSIFNTLREANPAMAHNMEALRFAIREAVQYEGVPLHTYKDMIDTRLAHGKAMEAHGNLSRARYATSPAPSR